MTAAAQEIRRRAKELCDKLDEIAELQEDVKTLKSDAKSEGYDMKAFAQIVREMRRGPKYQSDQLQLELVLDTYRQAVELPITLEDAQRRAAEAASTTPEAPRAAKARYGEPLQ